jgi:hypothetical protein
MPTQMNRRAILVGAHSLQERRDLVCPDLSKVL